MFTKERGHLRCLGMESRILGAEGDGDGDMRVGDSAFARGGVGVDVV